MVVLGVPNEEAKTSEGGGVGFFPLSEIEKQPYEEGCVNLSPSSHNCFKHWSLFEGSDLIKNCGITLKRGRN